MRFFYDEISRKLDTVDLDVFAANMVHEMFHAFQQEQRMDSPNDMKMMMYPESVDNYLLKKHESTMIADAICAFGQEKVELYRAAAVLRSNLMNAKRQSIFLCHPIASAPRQKALYAATIP